MCLPKKVKIYTHKRELYKNVYNSQLIIAPNWEKSLIFLSRKVNKQIIIIHSHNGRLLNNKKEQIMVTYSNMNDSQKLCDEWKKLDRKNSIVYTLLYETHIHAELTYAERTDSV